MPNNRLTNIKSHLRIRNATFADVDAIKELTSEVYRETGIIPYNSTSLRGPINVFSKGQFLIEVEGRIVAFCATFIISGEIALKQHSWKGITANGYASRHDPKEDWLYGMDVCVHSDYRGYRLGQRLYNERKKLCQELGLKGIVFGGRLPSLSKRLKKFHSIEHYIEQVEQRKVRDPVLSFQLRNGFEVLGVLQGYIPEDQQSLGYAVHLAWKNPKIAHDKIEFQRRTHLVRSPDTIRVGTVQFMQRKVNSFAEFIEVVTYFVDVVADYGGDFVVFPEFFTLQLLSAEPEELTPQEAIEKLNSYTPAFKESMRELALRFNINIIAGSHPSRQENGKVMNMAYIFLRDGTIHYQPKIHPTPNERHWWDVEGGDTLRAIDTDCGPIGVLICYDSEFPELARQLTDQGIHILFVPFCTDERQGYLRVRYCSQARAVENQIYVVMSGNVGNLPRVANMDVQYAQSCILTPCDFSFSRDGIAADTTPNVETVAIADLRPDTLMMARNNGTVKNLQDRRHDLYHVEWSGK